MDLEGDDELVSDLNAPAADGTPATNVGPLSEIDIPQHAFDAPRPGNARNRGRGFALDLPAPGAVPTDPSSFSAMVWDAGAGGYNNVKVGAAADAVLVGLGIGNYSDIVNSNGSGSNVGNANFSSAPFYGDVAKNEYSHYVMLVDVSVNPAQLVAVVDARGDFLDEEFAESTGQKQ
jgi:hypothetical protein